MKNRITAYSFDPAAKQVTLIGLSSIDPAALLAIVNVTAGVIIYNPSDANLNGTFSKNVVTLDYATGAMSSADQLLIYYDDAQEFGGDSLFQLLKKILTALMYPVYYDRTTQSSRSTIVGGTLPTVTTVSTVTAVTAVTTLNEISNIGSVQARPLVINQNTTAWCSSVRSLIS